MNRQYHIDTKQIREWFWVFVMSIVVVIAANVVVRVIPDFKDAQLCCFGFSIWMALLLAFGIPEIIEFRFEKISSWKVWANLFLYCRQAGGSSYEVVLCRAAIGAHQGFEKTIACRLPNRLAKVLPGHGD